MRSLLRFSLGATALAALVACAPVAPGLRPLSPEEMRQIASPGLRVSATVSEILPAVEHMVARTEREVLATGRMLTEGELALARTLRVTHPERVRIAEREVFPAPDDPRLAEAARSNDLIFGSDREAGRTSGYAILLKPGLADPGWVIAHELVHVGQYERMGGIRGFLQSYLVQLLVVGYERAPLEVEARTRRPAA